MLHFVTSYMKQNKSRKQTLESAQNGLEIIFETVIVFLQKGRKKFAARAAVSICVFTTKPSQNSQKQATS